MQFYQFFYKFATLNIILESDTRFIYLKELHDLTYKSENINPTQKPEAREKSLGKLFELKEILKRPKDQPIEVEIGVLF